MIYKNPLVDSEEIPKNHFDDTFDDTEDEYGPCHRVSADLPDPLLVLQNYREPEPRWLASLTRFARSTLELFLRERVAFYPGSGVDGQLFSLFGKSGSVHCFVHADFENSATSILDILEGDGRDRLYGYDPVFAKVMNPNWWQSFEQPPGCDWESRLGTSLFVVLRKRLDFSVDHGSEYLCFLHVSVDAYWLYWNLWGKEQTAPYAMLLQDHGFGGNDTGCSFGGSENALFEMASRAGLPEFLLVGKNTDPWDGYHLASRWSEGSGMHEFKRCLYRRLV